MSNLLENSKAYQAANRSVKEAEKRKDAYYAANKGIIEGYFQLIGEHTNARNLRTKIMLNLADAIPAKNKTGKL